MFAWRILDFMPHNGVCVAYIHHKGCGKICRIGRWADEAFGVSETEGFRGRLAGSGGRMTEHSLKSTDIVTERTASSAIAGERLSDDLIQLTESAKSRFAQTANTALVTSYWTVGKRIKIDILGNERTQYGREIVSALSRQLTVECLTQLPPRRLLEAKLHEAIRLAREQIAVREGLGMEDEN